MENQEGLWNGIDRMTGAVSSDTDHGLDALLETFELAEGDLAVFNTSFDVEPVLNEEVHNMATGNELDETQVLALAGQPIQQGVSLGTQNTVPPSPQHPPLADARKRTRRGQVVEAVAAPPNPEVQLRLVSHLQRGAERFIKFEDAEQVIACENLEFPPGSLEQTPSLEAVEETLTAEAEECERLLEFKNQEHTNVPKFEELGFP